MKQVDGGVCAVKGVRASGIKFGKMGLAVIAAEGSAAGVFTRNKIIAAPLIVTRENLSNNGNGRLAAVIANSGNANAFTGEQGITDAKKMAHILAEQLNVPEELVAVASTGVIGRKLDVDWISEHVGEVVEALDSTPDSSNAAVRAIMTTDLVEKESAVELESGVRIGGIAKGSGMIEPNMGTMLSFIYTDASLPADVLEKCLKQSVDKSFNMIVVDGDTSTNDIVLLTATGASSVEPQVEEFQMGLDHVTVDLAKMIARDGEGATKLIEAQVKGAKTENDARIAAKAIVRSPLVKSAVFGKDPNWGRVIAAVGYSGADIDQDKISLTFASGDDIVLLVECGNIQDSSTGVLSSLENIMAQDEIIIMVDIGLGEQSAIAWGCDLTYDYVKINADYTT
ncbi:MAG TPA: bifunctional ornithine acetyltransferase/N-acetylglutamate synthase [Methanosarcinaceae archaeon]|nr:bifunctional ornithine acetyltransferase/N-acetylglutamate synthase [Methanosarcinaceae archaeon]